MNSSAKVVLAVLKPARQMAVVMLVAVVAWFGVQAAVQHSYSAEVQPQSMLADDPSPCPTC